MYKKGRKTDMAQTYYLISDASRMVEVESHVLRYWEEELEIPIKRNELGHRYYTAGDIDRFREIKRLKEQGLQLKAVRMMLKDGRMEYQQSLGEGTELVQMEGGQQGGRSIEVVRESAMAQVEEETPEEKAVRLRRILKQLVADAVKENNKEMFEDIKEAVLKELDYQFRQWEEQENGREELRKQREEEHYRQVDELLRSIHPNIQKEKKKFFSIKADRSRREKKEKKEKMEKTDKIEKTGKIRKMEKVGKMRKIEKMEKQIESNPL